MRPTTEMMAPPSLNAVLDTLASEPGRYTPIAGGTELMVALGAGRLAQKHLISINHLKELRFIDATVEAVTIGSGVTFTDLPATRSLARTFHCWRRLQVGRVDRQSEPWDAGRQYRECKPCG